MPATREPSWTVLGDDDTPIEPVERYLAYLTDVERSPNTIKAYAHDLKDYWQFLAHRGLDWREVRLEDIGEYVAWLRLPPTGRDGRIAVLPSVEPHMAASTVNRKLTALAAFYAHQVRHGVDVGELLTTWQLPSRRGGAWKPFLHHISKKPQPRRTITVKAPKKLPRVLTVTEMQAIMDACDRLRDPSSGLCFGTPASASVKRWDSAPPTSPPRSARSPSCRGSTTTVPDPSPARAAPSRCRRS